MKKFFLLVAAALCACSSPLASTPGASGFAVGRFGKHSGGSTPIQHIVIIMQENRSFNDLFYQFPGARSASHGNGHGTQYAVYPRHLKDLFDFDHSHSQFLEDYDEGKDDGWDGEITGFKQTGPVCGATVNYMNEPSCWITPTGDKSLAFTYVYRRDVQPYWDMAHQYALGDRTFSSNNGPTFVSHQYLVAGESGHAVEVPDGQPWGCNANNKEITVNLLSYGQADPPVFSPPAGHEVVGPFPCFTYPTIVSNLDAAGITWKYYAQKADSGRDLEPFQADKNVWNNPADHVNIIAPDTRVLVDIASGNLAQVSWVTPSGLKSDHPGPQSGNEGPSWVGSIVNAIGESQYWNNTAIVIMWDEWGGYYDPVHPPQYPDPQTGAREGLGFRVPVIVVSPYAKAHYVSHEQHEIASTLRLIEETFGLPHIGACSTKDNTYADCRADGFDDMFDFTQQPIPFKPIQTKMNARFFETQVDNSPGDTS